MTNEPTSKRLEILKNSLEKKTNLFDDKLQNHFDTVKLANGQPLNDKRNGYATMKKWEKQNESLRTIDKSIDKTKDAIQREEWKIKYCSSTLQEMPQIILDLLEEGIITQWRKYPNRFFVVGGGKARIIIKKEGCFNSFYSHCTPEEKAIFKEVYTKISDSLKTEGA